MYNAENSTKPKVKTKLCAIEYANMTIDSERCLRIASGRTKSKATRGLESMRPLKGDSFWMIPLDFETDTILGPRYSVSEQIKI